jgi:hypothetical protein
MYRATIGMILALGLLVSLALAAPPAVRYVAPSGNDSWSGALAAPNPAGSDGPFRTLQRARDEVRRLKAAGNLGAGVTIQVRAGLYQLPETLTLDARDSGAADAPVVYQAFPGERPILTGARTVNDFKPYRGKILQADVAAQGLKGVPFKQLFLNGTRQILARTPNFDPKNPYGGGWAYVDGKLVSMYADQPGDDKRKLVYKAGDVPEMARPAEAEVFIFPRYNWWNNCVPIASIDRATRTITLTGDCSYPPRPGDRYYLRNVFEALDSPGEWYLDRATDTLYFWPPTKIKRDSVTASALKSLLVMKDVEYVTFQGFVMEGCDQTGLLLQNCRRCTIAGSTIRNTVGVWDWGFCAVAVSGGRDNRIVGNDIHDTGGNGISLSGGDRKTLTPANNVADNNYIHHMGQMYKQGVGVAMSGVGNKASHNLIHDGPRMGIIFSGNNLVIEYNEIRHVNLETEDTGAVYTGGRDWISSRGSIIRYNYFHDILGYGHDQYGRWLSPHFAWGVYLDDNAGGVDVIGNVLVRCPTALIHLHNGRDNVMENNLLIAGRDQQVQYSGWTDKSANWSRHMPTMLQGYNSVKDQPAWAHMRYMDIAPEQAVLPDGKIMAHNVFRRNIVWYDSPRAALYRLGNVNLDYNTFDENLICNAGGPVTMGLGKVEPPDQWAAWQQLGQDKQSLLADPLFVDAKHDDYRLRPDSPALKLGFKPIPFQRIGPYRSPLRASWPIVQAEGAREHPLISQDKLPIPPTAYEPRFNTPVAIPAVATAPTIDGKLAAGEWPAPQFTLAETPGRTPIKSLPPSAVVTHDATMLYVALTVPLPPGGKLALGEVWGQHDGAEVCLQALQGDKPAGPIYVIHSFATGKFDSATDAGATVKQARALGAVTRFAAQTAADRWTGEWAIPLASLGATTTGATASPAGRAPTFRFNLGLSRTSTTEWIVWAGTNAQNWVVGNAGLIVLQ